MSKGYDGLREAVDKKAVAEFYWKPVFWSDSYFIASVGENAKKVVQEYMKHQGGC